MAVFFSNPKIKRKNGKLFLAEGGKKAKIKSSAVLEAVLDRGHMDAQRNPTGFCVRDRRIQGVWGAQNGRIISPGRYLEEAEFDDYPCVSPGEVRTGDVLYRDGGCYVGMEDPFFLRGTILREGDRVRFVFRWRKGAVCFLSLSPISLLPGMPPEAERIRPTMEGRAFRRIGRIERIEDLPVNDPGILHNPDVADLLPPVFFPPERSLPFYASIGFDGDLPTIIDATYDEGAFKKELLKTPKRVPYLLPDNQLAVLISGDPFCDEQVFSVFLGPTTYHLAGEIEKKECGVATFHGTRKDFQSWDEAYAYLVEEKAIPIISLGKEQE